MKALTPFLLVLGFFVTAGAGETTTPTVIRANQIGYSPDDPKIALLSSSDPQTGTFSVGGFTSDIGPDLGAWGPFKHNYRLDFSAVKKPGHYEIEFQQLKSLPFDIG